MKVTIHSGLYEIKKEMQQRKHQRMTIKMRSFMTRIGQKRRTSQLVQQVNKQLNKMGMRAYSPKGSQWHHLKMDEWVTFASQLKERSPHHVHVKENDHPFHLYLHQQEALEKLEQMKRPFSGLLSIPTGGGKTVVAVHWLLKEGVKKGRKVLWLTHRHDLLDQAFLTIQKHATDALLAKDQDFTCRLVSSEETHQSIRDIQATDHVVIGTNGSLVGQLTLLLRNWLTPQEEILIIVDEAHHAVSETYEQILTTLSHQVKPTILGLTATPFRTVEEEKGLLKKRFSADIVYKLDVATLIARGILAEPIFKEMKTGVKKLPTLSMKDVQQIHTADVLPPKIEQYLAVHQSRNKAIVGEYVNGAHVYKKTLVFALNRNHAVQLTKQFSAQGIRADFFISGEEKKQTALEQFKDGTLDVLVNVNMLTEGTDLPDVQTVFLTRPTTSAILMTQMIGRAMRGIEAGGTETARIVHFQDDWPETISWITPNELYRDDLAKLKQPHLLERKHPVEPISFHHVQHLFEKNIHRDTEQYRFTETIPIGVYSFLDTKTQQTVDILVYEHLVDAFEAWMKALEIASDEEETTQIHYAERNYFKEKRHTFGYDRNDLQAIHRYVRETKKKPMLRRFKNREAVDVTKLAEKLSQKGLVAEAKKAFIDRYWHDEQSFLAVYFGFNKLAFRKRLELELLRLEEPDLFE
ncbi:DEAD/DEAH box helicase [Shouchella sp. 1P09AA]|uniref:DEAD/DEAH box helicase n=1 Tax=unclassified Shouchella TaxID=2893065 RepID=UPI0039A36FAA